MPDSLKKLRIFAASPSDVAGERAKLETVVDSLKPMADYLGLTLEVVDWREVVPDAGRPQQVIFDQLKPTSWDIFIGILWHRFGTPPGAKDKTGKDYLSGTEEEFKTAYELWKQHGKPRMVLYRCTRALPFDVDPDQLKNVREFFKLIEDVKGDYPTLYQAFDTIESFEKLVLNNLQKLLVEYGEESKTPITPEVVQVLAPKIPNNLPRRQAFFGRTKEMDTVMRALSPADRTWGVLVDGIGGIGKSAIAIEAAHLSQEKNSFDAFISVTAKTNILEPSGIKELNPPVRTLDEFLNETARILGQSGIAKLTGDEKRRALIDVLRSIRTLLIYDNLETLSKEEQEGIADFLRELPQGCKAIITSRRRGGEGGVWLRVEKLDWDAFLGIIKNQMLLDERLASKLNRVDESRWQELFDEINVSPLALVHTLGLMRVRATMTFDSALEMLRGNHDGNLQKFIFQEARKELNNNDNVALSALSFFVSPATFEAWMEVAELSHSALETTIDRLNELSLVNVSGGQERFSLHSLTCGFVSGDLFNDADLKREMGGRFTRFWMNYVRKYSGENNKISDWLNNEWININAAAELLWDFANISDNHIQNKAAAKDFVTFVGMLEAVLSLTEWWDESIRLSKLAYEIACEMKNWTVATHRAFGVAWILHKRNQIDETRIWVERLTDVATKSKTKSALAMSERMRGLVAKQAKEYDEAKQALEKSLALNLELGPSKYVAFLLNDLGDLARECKDYDKAEQYYFQKIELIQQLDLTDGMVSVNLALGFLEVERNNLIKARQWFNESLLQGRQLGIPELIAHAQHGLARVEDKEGHRNLALPLAQAALSIYERLQHKGVIEVGKFVGRLTQTQQ